MIADPQLISNIRSSSLLIPNIRNLAASHTGSSPSTVGTPRSHRSQSQSYQDTEAGEGHGEIQMLARRILEFVDGDIDVLVPASVRSSHMQPGTSVEGSTVSGREHEELRKSVREAFSSGSYL
jgi:vacuolar protein 8